MLNKKDLLRSKILIVDDELVNGKMLETVLRREGFVNVQFTPSPLESLEIYRKTRPDLVLLDLRMPEMDGFEVLQEFWKMETEFYPLVIVLTAESDHVIRLKALKAGAKDFLSKPLDLPEVLYRCQNLLEMRLLHNQLYDQKTRMEQMVQDRTVELRQANKQLKSEIAERAEIEKRLQKQNVLLELIAKNSPLNECLNRIQEFIEVYAESPACILLLDEGQTTLHLGYSWNLPEQFARELNRIPLKPESLPCGRAAATGQTVVEADLSVSLAYPTFRGLARMYGMQSVWSTPIVGGDSRVLGTFALYFDRPCKPGKGDLEWVQLAAHLAGIVFERARAEEKMKKIHEQLVHSEKLSAIGKLAASISHEFNNPIMGIRNVLEQLGKEEGLVSDLKELANLAVEECSRVMRLSTRLRDFYRPSHGQPVTLDLKAAVEDMVLLKRNEFMEKRITLECRIEDDLPPVHVVEDQIKQVILNLLQNAGEALHGGGGEITLSLERGDSDTIVLQVGDSGMGIPPEHLDQIFDPFFTTKKNEVKGTGLGLSVSYGIVKNHGGKIECESKPGQGTTFSVVLPLQAAGV